MVAVVAVFATFIFSPSGLSARDLVASMDRSLLLRATLWLGWLLLAAPATEVAFSAKGTHALRSLSSHHRGLRRLRARAWIVVSLLLLASVVEAPWIVLFVRGAGAGRALTSTTLAIGIEAALIARRPWLAAAGVACVVANVWAPGVPLAIVAVYSAWIRAPERVPSAWAWVRAWQPPLVAVTIAHLLRTFRVSRSRLVFSTMLMALGSVGLMALRGTTDRPISRAVWVMALPIALSASLFTTPALESERQMASALRVGDRSSRPTARWLATAAFLTAVGSPTTALAASATAAAQLPPILHVTGAVLAASIAISIAVGAWRRFRANRSSR